MRESDGTSVSATSALPEFPQGFQTFVATLLGLIPQAPSAFLVSFVFPYVELLQGVTDDRLHVVRKVLRRFGVEGPHAVKGYEDGLGAPEDAIKDQISVLTTASSITVKHVVLGDTPWGAKVGS
jgi:hypothetical protein